VNVQPPSATRAGFLNRIGAKVVSHVQLGDTPHLEKLIGRQGQLDALPRRSRRGVPGYTKFINTMKQEPVVEQLLPLAADKLSQTEDEARTLGLHLRARRPDRCRRTAGALRRSAGVPGRGREHGVRAIRAHGGHEGSDNARNVIGELQLVYNKTRQAAITKELSEIVSGAAAV
jgi:F-type H+-transporting ATPase subunit gamma